MNEDMYRELPQRTGGYEKRAANGLAVASLVMGILGIITSFFIVGIIFAGIGITLALLSRGDSSMHGVAIGGLVCSIIAVLIAIASFAVIIFLYAALGMNVSGGLL